MYTNDLTLLATLCYFRAEIGSYYIRITYTYITFQRVEVQGHFSSSDFMTCGVQQGIVWGPLVLSIYVKNLKSICSDKICLYADDSTILASQNDEKKIEVNLK